MSVRETSWRAQVLGPRWEAVVRGHVAERVGDRLGLVDAPDATLVLASVDGVDEDVARQDDVVAIGPGDVYVSPGR